MKVFSFIVESLESLELEIKIQYNYTFIVFHLRKSSLVDTADYFTSEKK